MEWQDINTFLVICGISFVLTTFLHATLSFSYKFALILFSLSFFTTTLIEYTGIHFGIPFGVRYDYHSGFIPRVVNVVPLFIPLAWFVLLYFPLMLFRSIINTVHSKNSVQLVFILALLCSGTLTALDFIIEPLAMYIKAWVWHEQGLYLGAPISNFVGWFIVGFFIYFILFSYSMPKRSSHVYNIVHLDRIYVLIFVLLISVCNLIIILRLNSFLPIMVTLFTFVPVIYFWYLNHKKELPGLITEPTS